MEDYLCNKIHRLVTGDKVIFSDSELDYLTEYDESNYFQVLQNPNQIGIKDRWEVRLSPEYFKKYNLNGKK